MKRPRAGGQARPETDEEKQEAQKRLSERKMRGHDQKKSAARRFAWGQFYDSVSITARHRAGARKKLTRDNF